MVVQQNERGGIDQESIPQYGTAVDGCLGERSLGEHHFTDDGEALCQEDGPNFFMVELTHPIADESCSRRVLGDT